MSDSGRAAALPVPVSVRMVDAHVHVWESRLPGQPGPLARAVRRIPGSAMLGALARPAAAAAAGLFPAGWPSPAQPYGPAEYLRDVAGLPLSGVVLAGAGWHNRLPGTAGALHDTLRELGGARPLTPLQETRWLSALAARSAIPVTALLARAALTSSALAAELDALQEVSPLVRGVVVAAARHPDPGIASYTHTYRLLAQPAFLDGFAQLAARELTFDVWVYAHDLPDVAALARRYPEVTIVIDHLATPAGVLGPAGQGTGLSEAERRGLLRSWSDDLEAVAQSPNTVVKISGLALPMLGHEVPLPGHTLPVAELVARAGPLVTRVLDVFGPDRTMWGSQLPVERPVATPQDVVSAITAVLGERGEPVLRAVFGDTARRVYGGLPGNLGDRAVTK